MWLQGDLTLFDEEDRRQWTREVLTSVMFDQQEELREQDEVRSLSDTLSRSSVPPGHSVRTDKSSERSRSSTRFDRNVARTCTSTKAEAEADAAQSAEDQEEGGEGGGGGGQGRGADEVRRDGSRTWRHTLIQLRTIFPGGGNYSGVGVPLDPHEAGYGGEGGGMYARLLEMRETQVEVMKMKMHVPVQQRGQVSFEKDGVRGVHQPPNLYSGNLRAELADVNIS